MASAVVRAYNGGLGAEPPAASRGRAPGAGGSGGQSPETESFSMFKRPMEWENLIDYLVF